MFSLMNRVKETKRRNALRQAVESLEGRILLAYTLDPSFAGDGVIDEVGGSSLAIQSDDKVLAVDQHARVLHRFNIDGSPDPSFGGTGQIPNPFPLADVLVSGSRILIAGAGGNSGDRTFKVAAYNLDGSPDLTFGGGDGIAEATVEDYARVGEAALAPGGKIVLAGQSWIDPVPGQTDQNPRMNVVRFNSDGTPDNSFAGDGTFENQFFDSTNGGGWISNVAVQSNGKIILAGHTTQPDGTDRQWMIRLNSDGTYDNTFHVQRFVNDFTSTPYRYESVNDVAITSGDKILLANDDHVERYNADGTPDTSFHQPTLIATPIALYALPDGRILVTGEGRNTAFLTRLLASGDLDTSFRSATYNQYELFQPASYYSIGLKVRPDSHNRVVVAGEMQEGGSEGPITQWLARLVDLPRSPFKGTPFNINDTIQAEDFDNGGEGVAYHDSDPTNHGGAYRPTEAVDIEATQDTGGGYDVGWTNPGEWMEYTFNVATEGKYELQARVASPKGGKVRYQIDGKDWGSGVIPNTGGFQNWTTVTLPAIPYHELQPANHVLRVILDDSGVTRIANFNWFRIVPAAGTGTGLVGRYYNSTHFTAPAFTRTDRTINFNWGTGSPDPRVGADTFSVYWSGQIEVPTTGRYTFYTSTDDGVRLYIDPPFRDRKLIIDKWANQPATEWSGSFDMVAGTRWGIILEYFENTGNASAKLQWSGPNVPKQVIPATQLYPVEIVRDVTPPSAVPNFHPTGTTSSSVSLAWDAASDNRAIGGYQLGIDTEPKFLLNESPRSWLFDNLQPGSTHTFTIAAVDTSSNYGPTSSITVTTDSTGGGGGGTGTGLRGEYFDNMDFTAPALTRTDPTIDFNWGSGSPDPRVQSDTFSVRWTGTITAPTTGRYTFYTTTDDGARLTINGQRIIDKLVPQAATEWSGSIDLIAGQKYSFSMEYFDRYGGALAKLQWAGPGISKQVVPQANLFS